MWTELAYLVESRYDADGEAGVPAERRAALMAVYGAFASCQIAFERLERERSSAGEIDAVLAMDVVLGTLHAVQPALRLFDPEPARELARHVGGARGAVTGANAKDRLKAQVETLRRLMAAEMPEDAAAPTLAAFSGARHRLGAFIRRKHSADELFGR